MLGKDVLPMTEKDTKDQLSDKQKQMRKRWTIETRKSKEKTRKRWETLKKRESQSRFIEGKKRNKARK